MKIPGFVAEVSIYRSNSPYVGVGGAGPIHRNVVTPQVPFLCGSKSCGCAGVDACLDLLITTDLCGPSIDCFDIFGVTFCTCTRK